MIGFVENIYAIRKTLLIKVNKTPQFSILVFFALVQNANFKELETFISQCMCKNEPVFV
jgi:hypothetical protein